MAAPSLLWCRCTCCFSVFIDQRPEAVSRWPLKRPNILPSANPLVCYAPVPACPLFFAVPFESTRSTCRAAAPDLAHSGARFTVACAAPFDLLPPDCSTPFFRAAAAAIAPAAACLSVPCTHASTTPIPTVVPPRYRIAHATLPQLPAGATPAQRSFPNKSRGVCKQRLSELQLSRRLGSSTHGQAGRQRRRSTGIRIGATSRGPKTGCHGPRPTRRHSGHCRTQRKQRPMSSYSLSEPLASSGSTVMRRPGSSRLRAANTSSRWGGTRSDMSPMPFR